MTIRKTILKKKLKEKDFVPTPKFRRQTARLKKTLVKLIKDYNNSKSKKRKEYLMQKIKKVKKRFVQKTGVKI